MTELFLQPVLSIPLIAAAAFVLIGATCWSAARLGRLYTLAAWRALFLAGIVGLLLGVSAWHAPPPQHTRPTVRILVDASRSMCIVDVPAADDRISRYEAIRRTWLDPATFSDIGADSRLLLTRFAEGLQRTTLQTALRSEPEGAASRIAMSIESALEDASPGDHILILSDGAETDRPTRDAFARLGDRAAAAGVQVHTAVVGEQSAGRDIALRAAVDDSFITRGQSTTLRIQIDAAGFDGRMRALTVRTPEGEQIARRLVELGAEDQVSLEVAPNVEQPPGMAVGIQEYIAEIEPLEGEIETANNTARAFVQVGAGRIRVAFFENEPYWDSKFFVAALRADAEIDLTAVMGLGPRRAVATRYTRSGEQQSTGSTEDLLTETELFDFDMIVLGKGVERWFNADRADLLWRYVVDRGGALLFLRGDPLRENADDALRDVVAGLRPVEWSDSTDEGTGLIRTPQSRRGDVIAFEDLGPTDLVINELPEMVARTRVLRERSLSEIWLRGRADEDSGLDPEWAAARDIGPAALARMAIGRGRVMAVLTDGLWRWAFLPSSLREYASVYRLLWGRAIRALVYGGEFLPGQQMSLSIDDATPGVEQPVLIEARARYATKSQPPMRLIVTEPNGNEQRLFLSRRDETSAAWRAAYTPSEEGVYRAELVVGDPADPTAARQTAPFVATEQRVEMLNTAARPDLLQAVAQRSGGRILEVSDTAALREAIRVGDAAGAAQDPVARLTWDRWWVFTILFVGLAGEWFLRRWKGAA